jgi:hypothetical protein
MEHGVKAAIATIVVVMLACVTPASGQWDWPWPSWQGPAPAAVLPPHRVQHRSAEAWKQSIVGETRRYCATYPHDKTVRVVNGVSGRT